MACYCFFYYIIYSVTYIIQQRSLHMFLLKYFIIRLKLLWLNIMKWWNLFILYCVYKAHGRKYLRAINCWLSLDSAVPVVVKDFDSTCCKGRRLLLLVFVLAMLLNNRKSFGEGDGMESLLPVNTVSLSQRAAAGARGITLHWRNTSTAFTLQLSGCCELLNQAFQSYLPSHSLSLLVAPEPCRLFSVNIHVASQAFCYITSAPNYCIHAALQRNSGIRPAQCVATRHTPLLSVWLPQSSLHVCWSQ